MIISDQSCPTQTLTCALPQFLPRLALLLIAVSSAVAALLLTVSNAEAQLPRDLHDQFERLLDELEPDLRLRFQTAIDNETSTVVFTLEEFRRFRDNPINPFEDLLRINPPDSSGTSLLTLNCPAFAIDALRPRNDSQTSYSQRFNRLLNQFSPASFRSGKTIATLPWAPSFIKTATS